MRPVLLVALTLASLFALAGPVSADKFRPVPGMGKHDKTPLQLRVVSYQGGVNGQLTVEIKNTGGELVRFAAEGLYFIPNGNEDVAPQRLGAVGPFKIKGDRESVHKRSVEIPAGVVATVHLEVFCIDSERDSPDSDTMFTLARHRMPTGLVDAMVKDARKAAADNGGLDAQEARQAVQRAVWNAREARRVKLQGDGRQEYAARHDSDE